MERDKPDNIILVGFMGCGKTSVGRMLAQALAWEFIDTDRKIEELTGIAVNEIFKKYSEVRFRSEEALMVRKISHKTNTVIATGGGTVLNQENYQILKQMGLVIHLYASLGTILQRVTGNKERPLLLQPLPVVESLWQERQSVYRQADLTIDTTDKDIDTIVSEILDLFQGGTYVAAENRS